MSNSKLCSNSVRLSLMMGLVFTYFLVELIVGHMTHSISLVADSFHMLSDFVSLIVGLVAIRISRWPRSNKNTFGWQRGEILGTMVNTVVLATLCFTLIVDAVQRYIKPESLEKPHLMLWVGSGGLLINLIGLVVLCFKGGHGHSHGTPRVPSVVEVLGDIEPSEYGPNSSSNITCDNVTDDNDNDAHLSAYQNKENKKIDEQTTNGDILNRIESQNNIPVKQKGHSHSKRKNAEGMNMRAVFLHVLSDALGSVIVVASALVFIYVPGDPTTNAKWKTYIDPSMTIVMVGIILFNTIPLMLQAGKILLQSVPEHIVVDALIKEIEKIAGKSKVHDFHIWQLSPLCLVASFHLRVTDLSTYSKISQKLKILFHNRGVHCTTIQPEFLPKNNNNETGEIKQEKCLLTCGNEGCILQNQCCPLGNCSAEQQLHYQISRKENTTQVTEVDMSSAFRKSNLSFSNEVMTIDENDILNHH